MGGYRLYRKFARGGMASVYMAHKTGPGGFGQFSAVKVVHPHLAARRRYLEMFLDEARIAASINHVNVCRVFDFGRSESTYYLALEHLMGATWGEVRQRILDRGRREELQRLPLLTAWVVAQACEGLHAAHETRDVRDRPLNIIHRDVSPQNIFVTFDGGVRVLDFGIARAAERLHHSRAGSTKGRIAYMSPEQTTSKQVDRRVDVWALGVVLWEGLACQPLFRRGTDAATMLAVVDDPVPPIPNNVGPVPRALVQIAHRALQKDPTQRFATAREMGEALSGCLAHHLSINPADVSRYMHDMFASSFVVQRNLRRSAAAASGNTDPTPPSLVVDTSIAFAGEDPEPTHRTATRDGDAATVSRGELRPPEAEPPPRRSILSRTVRVGMASALVAWLVSQVLLEPRAPTDTSAPPSETAILARVQREARALAQEMTAETEARVRAEVEADAAEAALALEERVEQRVLQRERARARKRRRASLERARRKARSLARMATPDGKSAPPKPAPTPEVAEAKSPATAAVAEAAGSAEEPPVADDRAKDAAESVPTALGSSASEATEPAQPDVARLPDSPEASEEVPDPEAKAQVKQGEAGTT